VHQVGHYPEFRQDVGSTKNRRKLICRTAERVSVVSESEVSVMFVTVGGEDPARNNSERHKKV
jgi:hypothetical protein